MSENSWIETIRLKNFMCYTDNVTHLKPGFNAILGPNGSGKSALVTAVVLGLGGDIRAMNRQNGVAEVINHRHRDSPAEVEVTLHEAGKIGCVIYPDSRIDYRLKGNRVSKQNVLDYVKKLHIQTDNLCQFLPQDVVKNFPCMTEKVGSLSQHTMYIHRAGHKNFHA